MVGENVKRLVWLSELEPTAEELGALSSCLGFMEENLVLAGSPDKAIALGLNPETDIICARGDEVEDLRKFAMMDNGFEIILLEYLGQGEKRRLSGIFRSLTKPIWRPWRMLQKAAG